MGTTSLYIATSLDGFIAKKNGDTSWLHDKRFEIEGVDYGYYSFYNSVSTLLMGYKTYEMIIGFDMEYPYKDKPNYVFRRNEHRLWDGKDENCTFVGPEVAHFVRELKKNSNEDEKHWIVGGSQLNTILLKAGLIDEIILSIMPVTIGSGIPLFASNDELHHFKVVSHEVFSSGVVQITYHPES